jgi:hypothetical protein
MGSWSEDDLSDIAESDNLPVSPFRDVGTTSLRKGVRR